MNLLYVFIGGGAGSLVRYLLGIMFARTSLHLPVATLAANVTACLIFAITLNFTEHKQLSDSTAIKLLVLTGFCGGLSTFSAFGYETFLLLKQQNYFWLVCNVLVSVLLCLGSFILIRK
jgi:fluoride exporter